MYNACSPLDVMELEEYLNKFNCNELSHTLNALHYSDTVTVYLYYRFAVVYNFFKMGMI